MRNNEQSVTIDYYDFFELDRNMDTKTINDIIQEKMAKKSSVVSVGCIGNSSKSQTNKMLEAGEYIQNCRKALDIFRKGDRFKKFREAYDTALDKAYADGVIVKKAVAIIRNIIEEINNLMDKGDFLTVITKCLEVLKNNDTTPEIILNLSDAYYNVNDYNRAIRIIDYGLSECELDNVEFMYGLLRRGARYTLLGLENVDAAQEYINSLESLYPESNMATVERVFWYMNTSREDLAYKLIDKYISKHPSDDNFRLVCAYDLVAHVEMYKTEGRYIASRRAYQYAVATCKKAISIFNDEVTQNALKDIEFYGTMKFNTENVKPVAYLLLSGLSCTMVTAVQFIQGMSDPRLGFIDVFFQLIGSLIITLPFIYFGIGLRAVSYRPYWQINKYELTGERELKEKIFVGIGNTFVWVGDHIAKLYLWLIVTFIGAMISSSKSSRR